MIDGLEIPGFPDEPSGRPAWLMTLADLALLLVGFFIFMQATQLDRQALAKGIREGFGVDAPIGEAMPVAAAAMLHFAPGSAVLPSSPAGLIAWARDAARDPRVTLKISGSVDGSAGDVDAVTRSGAVLAADRARAVAAVIAEAKAVRADRLTIVNAPRGTRRAVVITLAFSGPET